MREIKFRVWFPNKNEMQIVDLNEQIHDVTEWYIAKRDGFIMQFTGFRTNGIDIYDGDILTNDGGWWYVEWSQDEGQWECHPILGGNVWTNLGEIVPSKETWVKGNIYQNPELLN